MRWLTTAACFALATALLLTAPLRDRRHERTLDGEIGTPVAGNDLRITVHDTALAGTLADGADRVDSPGVFVVLDVTAEALRKRSAVDADLVSGDLSFAPSERAVASAELSTLSVGFPQRGSLVFELPAEALADATLRIRDHSSLDIAELIEVPLDLETKPAADRGRTLELPERIDPAEVDKEYR
jgi:hypothetical protein